MIAIGVMAMPVNFRYKEVFIKGKPQHDKFDPFRLRHPAMDHGHRAKIFSPFDALKGFSEAVAAKDVLYDSMVELSPEESAELDRRLSILRDLTYNSRMAKANKVRVSVTYYELCPDENHDAFGKRGCYRTVDGICYNVDTEVEHTILIDHKKISFARVLRIESSEDVFKKDWDDPWME